VYGGSSVNYTVSVTNNDTSGCPATTFNLASAQPTAWIGTFSTPSLSINPGQSASATLTEAPPTGTVVGTYSVSASATSATNSTYSKSAAASCTVLSGPTITISVPSSSYTRGTTVPITATVLNAGSPVSGASVTFTVQSPTGATTKTTTTGSDGTATWNYKLAQKAKTGTYVATAQVTVNSTQVSTLAPATFIVQ
jgi:hypothetical protein